MSNPCACVILVSISWQKPEPKLIYFMRKCICYISPLFPLQHFFQHILRYELSNMNLRTTETSAVIIKNFLHSGYSMTKYLMAMACKISLLQTSQNISKFMVFKMSFFSVETYQCLYSFLHLLYDWYEKGSSDFLLPRYLTTSLISMSITKTFNKLFGGSMPVCFRQEWKHFSPLFAGILESC